MQTAQVILFNVIPYKELELTERSSSLAMVHGISYIVHFVSLLNSSYRSKCNIKLIKMESKLIKCI